MSSAYTQREGGDLQSYKKEMSIPRSALHKDLHGSSSSTVQLLVAVLLLRNGWNETLSLDMHTKKTQEEAQHTFTITLSFRLKSHSDVILKDKTKGLCYSLQKPEQFST